MGLNLRSIGAGLRLIMVSRVKLCCFTCQCSASSWRMIPSCSNALKALKMCSHDVEQACDRCTLSHSAIPSPLRTCILWRIDWSCQCWQYRCGAEHGGMPAPFLTASTAMTSTKMPPLIRLCRTIRCWNVLGTMRSRRSRHSAPARAKLRSAASGRWSTLPSCAGFCTLFHDEARMQAGGEHESRVIASAN